MILPDKGAVFIIHLHIGYFQLDKALKESMICLPWGL